MPAGKSSRPCAGRQGQPFGGKSTVKRPDGCSVATLNGAQYAAPELPPIRLNGPHMMRLPTNAPSARAQRPLAHRFPLGFQAGRVLRVAALGAALLGASCASSDDDESDENAFVLRSTGLAVAPTGAAPIGDGDFLAFLVSEDSQGTGGTNYNEANGDLDRFDDIAVRINTANRTTNILNVAAEQIAFSRRTLLLVVEEADDSKNWNGDADTLDRVLLYVTSGATEAVYYDDVAAGSELAVIGGTVVYASATVPTMEFESNLRIANVATNGAAPDSPVAVITGTDSNANGITFSIAGSDGDIVFLTADETVDGDLNQDSDDTDTNVFAVLDAGAVSPEAIVTERSLAPLSTPTAVPVSGGGEWLVAFLVDEASQTTVDGLNNPSDFGPNWVVVGCTDADTDSVDFVLHWFQLADLAMSTPVVNTGLVGEEDGIAYALRSQFVGVVSPEDQQGSGTCVLNGDSDDEDGIFRWINASNPANPVLPVTTTSMLVAVDSDIPGGSGGVVRLADAWVVLVDEDADGRSNYDTEPGTDRKLLLVHNPTVGAQSWNALHGTQNPLSAVSSSWMTEDPDSTSRFYATFREETLSINGGASDINGDGDSLDVVPTTPSLVTGNRLTFPGIGTAASPTAAGIVVEQNIGYFRVSEAAEGNRDLNGNNQTDDVVLQRYSLSAQFPRTIMGTCNSLDTPAVSFGPGTAEFGAFLIEEAEQGTDQNGDGDVMDFVVRYFRLP